MLRPHTSPFANFETATHVYAMYSWVSRHTGEPCHDLIRIVPKEGESVTSQVERIKTMPVVKLQGGTISAKLYNIYLEQPNEPNPIVP